MEMTPWELAELITVARQQGWDSGWSAALDWERNQNPNKECGKALPKTPPVRK
jgi:hypothetical protein